MKTRIGSSRQTPASGDTLIAAAQDSRPLSATDVAPAFTVLNVRTDSPATRLHDRVLARLDFTGNTPTSRNDPRHIPVGLRSLDDGEWSELWLSNRPVRCGEEHGIAFAENGEVLFGSVFLGDEQIRDLRRATLRIYVLIDSCLHRWGYPHWLRAWHFLARITDGDGEQERYRRFNAGRRRAIELHGELHRDLPAATAIGTHSSGLSICFLAGKRPITQVENPRQISAFNYPAEYGAHSPAFSRAALYRSAPNASLFVSGTASIVGHATRHRGDAIEQTREALRNVNALLEHATERHFDGQRSLLGLAHKIYVRHPEDWPAIREVLSQSLQSSQPVLPLHADICRRDLLVEIEGVYGLASPSVSFDQ